MNFDGFDYAGAWQDALGDRPFETRPVSADEKAASVQAWTPIAEGPDLKAHLIKTPKNEVPYVAWRAGLLANKLPMNTDVDALYTAAVKAGDRDVLDHLSQSMVPEDRMYAASSRATSREHLERMAEDTDPAVRDAARKTLKVM